VSALVVQTNNDETSAGVCHRYEVLEDLAPLSLVSWIEALFEVDVLGLALRSLRGRCRVAQRTRSTLHGTTLAPDEAVGVAPALLSLSLYGARNGRVAASDGRDFERSYRARCTVRERGADRRIERHHRGAETETALDIVA
jgi:hypothetical protein